MSNNLEKKYIFSVLKDYISIEKIEDIKVI